MRCKVCSMWKLVDPPNALTKKQRLEVIDQLKAFGSTVHVEITGGEPFKKFDELLEIASRLKEQGNTMGVVTSGYLLTPAVVKRLEGSGITHIAFSVDFPSGAQHDSQRGRIGTFEHIVHAIRMLVEMKKHGRDVPSVGIDSIIMDQNLNYLEDVSLLAAELDTEEVLFQPIQPDFGLSDQLAIAKFRNWLPTNQELVSAVFDRIEELRGGVPLGQTKQELLFIRQYFFDPFHLQLGLCRGPQCNLVVDVSGQVLHCFGHARTGLRPLGAVPKGHIVDLWRSETANRNRKTLASCGFGCGMLLCHGRSSLKEKGNSNEKLGINYEHQQV